MDTGRTLCCQDCGKYFKRQDHLDRHRLSHGRAKYKCDQASCGMAFHRRDVLSRHQQVHRFNPSKRRRRPRRGINPEPLVSLSQAASSEKKAVSQAELVLGLSTNSRPTNLDSSDCPIKAFPLGSFDFCFEHYLQTCVRRWPFIHHTWLIRTGMTRAKQLSMATLGGCTVAEYRQDASIFFQEARILLSTQASRDGVSIVDASLDGQLQFDPYVALDQFQTYVLLLEFALWNANAEAKHWALRTTFDIASITVPRFISHIENIQKPEQTWEEWVHEEQCVRTLWAFYITTQKAIHQYPCFVSTLRAQQHTRLPRSDILFNAFDEQIWSQCGHNILGNGITMVDLTLKSALQLAQSKSAPTSQILADLTPTARHVVLVAFLEIYTNGARHLPVNIDNTTLPGTSQLVAHACPGLFSPTLLTLRSLWHLPPGDLFSAKPPRSIDLQNVLLLNHLEIFVLTHLDDRLDTHQRSSRLCAAAGISTDILESIYENEMLDVTTKAPWLTDAASKQYVLGFARVMVKWASNLPREGTIAIELDEDEHATLCRRVHGFLRRHCASHAASCACLTSLLELKEAVKAAWCDVLRCPAVRWCAQEDL